MTADEAESHYAGLIIHGMEDRVNQKIVPVDWAVIAKNRTGCGADEPWTESMAKAPLIVQRPLRILIEGLVVDEQDYQEWRTRKKHDDGDLQRC